MITRDPRLHPAARIRLGVPRYLGLAEFRATERSNYEFRGERNSPSAGIGVGIRISEAASFAELPDSGECLGILAARLELDGVMGRLQFQRSFPSRESSSLSLSFSLWRRNLVDTADVNHQQAMMTLSRRIYNRFCALSVLIFVRDCKVFSYHLINNLLKHTSIFAYIYIY